MIESNVRPFSIHSATTRYYLIDVNTTTMKILNMLFAGLFVLSAALQYNDPDPLIWITLYMYSAVLCLLAARGKFYSRLALAGILVYGIYAVYLFFSEDGVADWLGKYGSQDITGSMKAENAWIENTREFFGLLIMIAVLTANYFYFKRKRRNFRP